MMLGDSIAYRQTKTGAFLFAGQKRCTQLRQYFRRDSFASVPNGKQDFPVFQARADGQPAAGVHGLKRVADKIEE